MEIIKLQSAARAIVADALTQAKRKKSCEELNQNQAAANPNQQVFVVFQIVDESIVTSLKEERFEQNEFGRTTDASHLHVVAVTV